MARIPEAPGLGACKQGSERIKAEGGRRVLRNEEMKRRRMRRDVRFLEIKMMRF